MRFKISFKILAAVCLATVVLALGFSLWCNHKVDSLAKRKVTSDIGAAPHCRVALVLGTNPKNKAGRPNTYFTQRVKTAAALYKAGKADYILVSGDNHTHSYDEPSAMRDALVARGVPRSRIVLDYAGFRTLDSVVRAKEVFGCEEILIVSQADHAARAVTLIKADGSESEALTKPVDKCYTQITAGSETVTDANGRLYIAIAIGNLTATETKGYKVSAFVTDAEGNTYTTKVAEGEFT